MKQMMKTSLPLMLLVATLFCTQTEAAKMMNPRQGSPNKNVDQRVIIGGQNFTFVLDEWVEWGEAAARCGEMGQQLVTLDTRQKNNLIFDWIKQNPDYDEYLWTSGHRSAGATAWQWTPSGEAFTFTDWGRTQPSRLPEQEACMNFAVWYGGWDDDSCIAMPINFLCEDVPAL